MSKAFGIVHYFPGGTKKQYEASIAAVHPNRRKLPKGQIFHAAGPAKGGWTIVAFHVSKQSWLSFRNRVLLPAFQKGIKGGFTQPPQETQIKVHNLQR
ncbi:MAG: hypothetical protein HZA93_22275 [Verrucomicrobia bacterium]|nr:hypothetical protein [Verrucomicrobiota bacterium]